MELPATSILSSEQQAELLDILIELITINGSTFAEPSAVTLPDVDPTNISLYIPEGKQTSNS
jgi:hypothetical protein